MEPLAEILKRRLSAHKVDQVALASEVCFYAGRLLEKYLSPPPGLTWRVQYLHQTILYIGVSHSSLAQELRGFTQEVLADLAKRFGPKRVTAIRIKHLTSQ